MKRLAILYSALSGYSAACQRALQERYGVELLVFHWPVGREAPFHQTIYKHIAQRYDKSKYQVAQIIDKLKEFNPDAMLIAGWMDRDYLRAARVMRRAGVPVIAGSDTQWKSSLRQQVAGWIAPWYLHPSIDILWVTGERQRQLAYQLGYTGQRCWTGFYACDWDTFAVGNPGKIPEREDAFLFVGRYLPRKGISALLEAYRQYRRRTANPWKLITAGAGPQESLFICEEGIENLGFIQPESLPALMHRARAFVLPSLWEPWGVVVQEAATAGLPMICSDVCGAAVHLLRDGFNGYTFDTGNAAHLAECMYMLSRMSPDQWEEMSNNSFQLSRQFTPALWADTLYRGVARLRGDETAAEPQLRLGERVASLPLR